MHKVILGSGRVCSHCSTSPLLAYRCLLTPKSCGIPFLATHVRNKSNFGGITFDPYSLYKRKLLSVQLQRNEKIELVSRDRRERQIDLPIHVSSINWIITPIIPLERYARASIFTKLGLRQRYVRFFENLKVIYSGYIIRKKLKKIDPFVSMEFARWAQERFIEMQAANERRNYAVLKKLTTINLYERLKKRKRKYSWSFLEEMERPRVVSARVVPFNTKDNIFAQVIVRLCYKQTQASYYHGGKLRKEESIRDHTGELVKCDPDIPTQVITYVVLERHLVTPKNTSWKIHSELPKQLPWRLRMELSKENEGHEGHKETTNMIGSSAELPSN